MSKRLAVIREASTAIIKEPTAKQAQRQKIQTDRMTNKKIDSATPKNNASVFSSKPEPNRGPGSSRHPSVARAHTTRPTSEGRESEFSANRSLSSSVTKRPAGHHLMRNGVSMGKPHPTAQHALQAYHGLANKEGVKIHHVKEEASAKDHEEYREKTHAKLLKTLRNKNSDVEENDRIKKDLANLKSEEFAMAVGGGDPAHVTNPTDNYAAQRKLRDVRKSNMARRKKAVDD